MSEPSSQNQSDASSSSELETLQKQCDEYLNGWKRARADYENLLKETARDREQMGALAMMSAVIAFLPVYTHLKQALANAPSPQPPHQVRDRLSPPEGEGVVYRWIEGVRHIKSEFEDIFRKLGITEIETIGNKFDPSLHESVGFESDETKEDGVVLKEAQGGYRMGDKVIQPARVVVNRLEEK